MKAKATLPTSVPPPITTVPSPSLAVPSPSTLSLQLQLHNRALKLTQHVAEMQPAKAAGLPEQPLRWMSEILCSLVEFVAAEQGDAAAHDLIVRLMHLNRAVVSDVAYQLSQR